VKLASSWPNPKSQNKLKKKKIKKKKIEKIDFNEYHRAGF
jgi:hypothetical protein